MDSPPLHSPMDPPMKPPYRGKRGERRRHAIGEGEGSKRKRGRPGGWRGTLPANDIGGIHNALPSPQHGLSEPPPHGVRHGHADKRGKARCCPRRTVEQRDGHAATRALAQVSKEAHGLGTKGAVRRDGERDEAHARGERAILGADAVRGDGVMGGMAAGISVLGSNVGGAGSVEGFDVEERVGLGSVKAT